MSKILLVFEGEKTEPAIYSKIESCFFRHSDSNSRIITCFKTDIYSLYNKLRDGDGFLDPVITLRESHPELKGLSQTDFGAIYLFFDYDLHVDNYLTHDEKNCRIEELLNYFNNETDNGSLFISYPMVEAYKDWDDIDKNCKSCSGEISGTYKEEVNTRYPQHGRVDFFEYRIWLKIFQIMIAKALALVTINTNNRDFDTIYQNLTQIEIFKAQKNFYKSYQEIVILTPIPFVLLNELGRSFYSQNILDCLHVPSCNFLCFRSQQFRDCNRNV